MARTGISIKVSNTVLGSLPRVNSNSLIVVAGATATTVGDMPFTLGVPFMLQSVADLDVLGITEENNKDVFLQVSDFFSPTGDINNTGTILWLVGVSDNAKVIDAIADSVRDTVVQGFQYRPRNILISTTNSFTGLEFTQTDVQNKLNELYVEGFSTVAVMGDIVKGDVSTAYNTIPDLSTLKAGMVGTVIFSKRQKDRPCVGMVGGMMASTSVGTSLGDSSLPLGAGYYFADMSSDSIYVNTPCSKVAMGVVNILGDKQYIFARTRPPRNGLWLNDGATAEDATTSLSTLESGRVIASIVDDVREFFTPYINGRVPVTRDGDIQPTYKRVVLDNAHASIIQPYISAGDISDARISLVAKNDDMVGTRTWEVTLEILSAVTLRWIDGYVFYVKSLN